MKREFKVKLMIPVFLIFLLSMANIIYPVSASNPLLISLGENEERQLFNITLTVTDWEGKSLLRGLNVSIYNLNGSLIISDFSNDYGQINVILESGEYLVLVFSDSRIVGLRSINVTENTRFNIRTYSYDLNVTCINWIGRPLPNVFVLIYEQTEYYTSNSLMFDEGRGRLIRYAKTNDNGIAFFNSLWNGTYKVVVSSGRIIGEKTINLTKSDRLTITCNVTPLTLRVVSSSIRETPLSNAVVLLQHVSEPISFRDVTDRNGYIRFDNVYVGNYTVFINWMDREIFSGTIRVEEERLTVKCPVFEVSFRVTDFIGNPLPYSQVTVRRMIGTGRFSQILENLTNENGLITLLLPSGIYEFSFSNGIFSAKRNINVNRNYSEVVQCNIDINTWLTLTLISIPLLILSLLMERKRIRSYLEFKRYQNMLMKLEAMYNSGLVEYKIYRKLREEYETKLMKIGGRRVR